MDRLSDGSEELSDGRAHSGYTVTDLHYQLTSNCFYRLVIQSSYLGPSSAHPWCLSYKISPYGDNDVVKPG
jgi:hypothetical protein